MSSPDVSSGARHSPVALVERVAAVFAEGEHKLEAMRARAEYLDRAGKVFDDDAELFEGRIASFLEWYIIERGFRDGPPPALRVVTEPEPVWGFSADERRRAVHLATSLRSLFEISAAMQRGPGGRVELEDLLGGGRFSVLERRSTIGLEVGALFEARLFWDGESVVFGKTFLFHPPDARESVLRLVDRVAQAGGTGADDLLFKLSRAHVKWHRLGHLSAAKVYGAE